MKKQKNNKKHRKIRIMQQAATATNIKEKMTDEVLFPLIRAAQSGDLDAECRVLEDYLYIIDITLARSSYLNVDCSAKYHGAYEGLRLAIKNYNFSVAFGAYAMRCAYYRMLREINQTEYLVALPGNIIEECRKEGVSPYATVHLNTFHDISMRGKHLETMETDCHHFHYYDAPHDHIDHKNIAESCMNRLNNMEKDAMLHASGVGEGGLREYGKKHGLSGERFRQIQEITLEKLRKFLKRSGYTAENVLGTINSNEKECYAS